jgi:hypothetical protein
LRLIREQKELIAERKAVLAEEGVHSGDDTVPQYMDERIDTITIQADFLSQQIRYLSQFSKLNHRGIKKREELLALMDKLDHKSMTNLLFDVLQLDMVPLTQINSLQSNMIEYIDQTMVRLQEGVVTMRRSGRFNHNQHDISETLDSVMMKIVKSPIRCLPNGLLLAPLSGKIPKRCS